jgi:transposase
VSAAERDDLIGRQEEPVPVNASDLEVEDATHSGSPLDRGHACALGTADLFHRYVIACGHEPTDVPWTRACLPSRAAAGREAGGMGPRGVLTDDQWAVIERLLPPVKGEMGRPATPHRPVVEGIIYRYRAGVSWRDLPRDFGPWQTVWKRHHKWSADGTWDRVLAEVLADADAAGLVDWKVSADSSVVRAHQHGTNTTRPPGPPSYTGAQRTEGTGGEIE